MYSFEKRNKMEKINPQLLKLIARNVRVFHIGWILMVLLGTVVEIFYTPYAKIQFCIIIGTFLFQLACKGNCPLTLFENLLLEKIDPAKAYDESFIRHYLKKYLKIDSPKGTTLVLLTVALLITIWRTFF